MKNFFSIFSVLFSISLFGQTVDTTNLRNDSRWSISAAYTTNFFKVSGRVDNEHGRAIASWREYSSLNAVTSGATVKIHLDIIEGKSTTLMLGLGLSIAEIPVKFQDLESGAVSSTTSKDFTLKYGSWSPEIGIKSIIHKNLQFQAFLGINFPSIYQKTIGTETYEKRYIPNYQEYYREERNNDKISNQTLNTPPYLGLNFSYLALKRSNLTLQPFIGYTYYLGSVISSDYQWMQGNVGLYVTL